MKLDEGTVPRLSRTAIVLMALALLVAIFALVRDDVRTHHRQATAQEARQRAEEQRTADNKAALEAQARGLADFDTLLGQLQIAGIPPAISREQAQADVTPITTTTTTTTTVPRRSSPPPTTSPPTSPPPSQPPRPARRPVGHRRRSRHHLRPRRLRRPASRCRRLARSLRWPSVRDDPVVCRLSGPVVDARSPAGWLLRHLWAAGAT